MHTKETRREALRLRREKRLSLKAVAKELGISKGTASLWLRKHPLTSREVKERVSENGRRRRKWPPLRKHRTATCFERDVGDQRFCDASLGHAVAWFMSRGYGASIPVGQEPYDLVVDSDEGLQKIQVKSTNRKNRWSQFFVTICKRVYDGTRQVNASGKRRRTTYATDEVDWFFILTGDHDVYLIPRSATASKMSLTLDRAYANYKR